VIFVRHIFLLTRPDHKARLLREEQKDSEARKLIKKLLHTLENRISEKYQVTKICVLALVTGRSGETPDKTIFQECFPSVNAPVFVKCPRCY